MLLAVVGISAKATEERSFTIVNAANGLADNSAQAVVCTRTGRMIIATIGNINFYNGAVFNHIFTRREFQYPLPLYRGNYRFNFDRYHHLWLKNAGSVTCTNLTMEQFELNTDSVLRAMGCPMPVQDLFVDSVGYLWTLSDEGLYGLEQKQTYNVLRDRNLQEVDVFGDMLITFYDNGEEVGQDISTGNTLHRTRAFDWETAQRYSSTSTILRYKDGYFQLRSGDREAVLLFFNVAKKEWTTLMETPFRLNNLALKDNKLYIASQRGYCIYDISTRQEEWVHELTLNNGDRIDADINAVVFDRQGGLWAGTDKRGLLYSRPNSTPFKIIPQDKPEAHKYIEAMQGQEQNITEFQGMNANCMFTDSRGWSWIGTTAGLYMYKDPHQEPVVFNRKTGLYNDVIHAIVEDANQNMWVSTSAGISFILFKGEEVEFVNNFNTTDNLPSESFINCKALLLPDSQIVMQTIDHVILFRPEHLDEVNRPHKYKLFPKLSKLMVNGYNVEPNVPLDGNIIIDCAIPRATTINLNSNQTTLTFTFSALNYCRPLQSYYHVRIKGLGSGEWKTYSYFNSDYVDEQGLLHLQLFNLEPGEYTIEMQASMFPDMWDGEPFPINIVVKQSWWQAKGMYYFYAIVIALLLLFNFYIYVRNTRMRVKRNHEEGDIISKICMFVDRADGFTNEKLAPVLDEYGTSAEQQLSSEFIDIMEKLMPMVRENRKEYLTMRKLSEEANVDVVRLYEIVTANIYKSPRDMVRRFRLRQAEEMLLTTDKTLEQISDECGFYTPNYFMGNFFHVHKRTPQEYREERR